MLKSLPATFETKRNTSAAFYPLGPPETPTTPHPIVCSLIYPSSIMYTAIFQVKGFIAADRRSLLFW